VQQIVDWLDKIGMSGYAPRFAENRIDFSVLPDLTDQDLEKMGVILGDRRKILRAIAALSDSGKAAHKTTAPAHATSAVRPLDAAERRQVTIMFSDLVGSTALSVRMDPEDLREVISAYHKCVAEIVNRLGGYVAKYMGDGVLVYFGYPQAHEDDGERASAPAAHSECALSNFHFGLNGDEVTTQATSTGGAACKYHYFGDASTTITSASVIQQPSYGVLTQTGTVHFEYHPNAKFRGFDHYTTEVCGHGPSGVVSCSHINHEVTVQ
jgi:SAM domain (Sterile alpha motif)/Adenylate and Guanylate cyclase catalytic domain